MRNRLIFPATLAIAVVACGEAFAETRQYCITCTEPDQSYLCQIETPYANPVDKGLQLYCIIRTSKDGGHRSCAVQTGGAGPCDGPVKTYTYQAPEIPPELESAVRRYRGGSDKEDEAVITPPQKGGEPETLVDMTRGAVGASREGVRSAGQTVGGAAGTTKEKVGSTARGVGSGISKAAGKVGSATKKTGGAVGGVARTAWDCVTSWFKECGGQAKEPETPQGPTPLQPRR